MPQQSDKDEQVLLPCPICGGEAAFNTTVYSESHAKDQGWEQATFHGVNCVSCGINNRGLVGHLNQRAAALRWNRRVSALPELTEREKVCAECGTKWTAPVSYCPQCGLDTKDGVHLISEQRFTRADVEALCELAIAGDRKIRDVVAARSARPATIHAESVGPVASRCKVIPEADWTYSDDPANGEPLYALKLVDAPVSTRPERKTAGMCMYCGEVFHVESDDQADVAKVYEDTLAHDRICSKNPLAKDAARYRWLRHDSGNVRTEEMKSNLMVYQGAHMDELIDKHLLGAASAIGLSK